MCTALGQEALVNEALEAGASDFILKPFQENDVLRILDKVVGQ
jgi:two-component system chemotaxis response regulator CheY